MRTTQIQSRRAAEPATFARVRAALLTLSLGLAPWPAAAHSPAPPLGAVAAPAQAPKAALPDDAPLDALDRRQLWSISTRGLPQRSPDGPERFKISRYRADAGWQESTLEELLAPSPAAAVTTILVPGNMTDGQTARSRGRQAFRALERAAPRDEPFRLLVWSWPSDRVPGSFREDARIKARRTIAESFYLAQLLARLDSRHQVSLVGHSFGARVITGALHLAGGGRLDRRTLPEAPLPAGRRRAVLLAAALDDTWLLPGREHGAALSQVEQMMVTVNPNDRVLRWFRFISPNGRAEALGASGLDRLNQLGSLRGKLVQVNVSGAVGGDHDWTRYVGSSKVVSRLGQVAFKEREAAQTAATEGEPTGVGAATAATESTAGAKSQPRDDS